MDMSKEEYDASIESFRNKTMLLLNEYAPILGPQNGDEGFPINNQETIATDAIIVVNWMDMDSSNSFLHAYPITDVNVSMLVGMLYRALNLIS